MKVFGRCLKAVSALKRGELKVEVLLVDNNSQPALASYKEVQEFLQSCANSRIIIETKQGSGHARITGYKTASAPLLVTFDDDNEPEENYLLEAKRFDDLHPDVGVFGPGIIKVEFTEGAPSYLQKFRWVFQETTMDMAMITDSQRPNDYYPYGTGMVIKKQVALDYCAKVEEGKYNSIGRIGKILTSCEDLQLVWHCLKYMKLNVGRTPACKLNHLINGKKANFKYWKKLSYGGGFSWLPARFEIFPEELSSVSNTGLEVRKSILRLCKVFVYNFYRPQFFLISVASQLGILDSIYHLNKKKTPFYLNWTRSLLGLGK